MPMSRVLKCISTVSRLAVCLLMVICGHLTDAKAAGFEYGPQGLHALGRGGAFTAKADDASAFYWNPSKLSFLRGTRLHYSHNFTDYRLSFQRDDEEYQNPTTGETETITHSESSEQEGFFPMGLSLALTSDFGLDDWGFALGLVGPSAMGSGGFADDSTTRYAFLKQDVVMAFLTASVAWKFHHDGRDWFGLGASLQYVALPWLDYSLMMVGPGGPPDWSDHPSSTKNDFRVDLHMSDWTGFSAILGGWVRPIPELEIAISARVVPINFNADGEIHITYPKGSMYEKAETTVPATLSFTYPASVQTGIRYRHLVEEREVFDIEVDFVWEQWSALNSFDVDFKEETTEILGSAIPLEGISLARNYQDTYSVRLGGQWNAIPKWFTVSLGAWWESAAQPAAYTNVDFASFDRFGVAAGLRTEWRGIEIGISYAHIFQLPRDVSNGQISQQLMDFDGNINSPYAVNNGHYTSSYDVITIGLNILWDTLIYGE